MAAKWTVMPETSLLPVPPPRKSQNVHHAKGAKVKKQDEKKVENAQQFIENFVNQVNEITYIKSYNVHGKWVLEEQIVDANVETSISAYESFFSDPLYLLHDNRL